MKNYLKFPFLRVFTILTLTLLFVNCSSDDTSIFETPDDGTDDTDDTVTVATLIYNEGDSSNNVVVANANGEVGTTVPGRIKYTSTNTTQRRLYITQNVSGQGDMPFNNLGLDSDDLNKVLKADGSIDLDGATKKEIDFTFNLPVPDIDNGSIVYSFWTTKGKGDFRDPSKRLALGVGTITVTVGTGTNPAAAVREFSEITLYAPALDGSTETFFSLLDEQVYQINVGPEFRAFWDFGYYYGASGVSADDNASLASTYTYDESFGFDVDGLKPGSNEEDSATETLNETFFGTSSLDADSFDAIALSGDLDSVANSGVQKITNLSVGDVIEFVDNYGKKGLIKITDIQAGYDNADFIKFDVKIQP